MSDKANWDWDTKEKLVADINEWRKRYPYIRELVVSDDGEKIATVAKTPDRRFIVIENGRELNEGTTYERAYSLKYSPENKLIYFVLDNYEWSVVIDSEMWEEKFDYVWNLTLNPAGNAIAVNVRKDNMSAVCLNGIMWENTFFEARDVAISLDGKRTASHVQVKMRKELDNVGFMSRMWTVAVDGNPWENNFINTWGATFSSDGNHVAAVVRTDMSQYTIAVDGRPWENVFGAVWEPEFRPGTSNVIAPVQTPKGWTLAEDGKPIWDYYSQVWKQIFTPDGKKLAAVAALTVGKWTVVVDGTPWNRFFSQAVLKPVFSPDGKRIAAVVKDSNRGWTIAVDGVAWHDVFDNIWDPVINYPGTKIAARAEKDGKYYIVVDGRTIREPYEILWDPIFSPDGNKILIRGVKGDKYIRKIISLGEI